ncbi:hypothetical protein BGW38_010986 [Lunasporangiospora selenospora]|uniref:Uncharacterized protein n=1 Tax=Lunasporangiospora selenospora TaxID=979761 RepID=A0A9P6FWD3_9FUNG|nr:hypothetical protein BGW38_010986 [Lunasporangiospora selenospora]
MSSQKSTLPTLTKSHGTRTPKFLPWSREQFHSRLETFRPSTWFDKPKLVNAVECAKRGWINKGEDRLECCGGCSGVVIVKTEYGHDKSSESPSMDTDSAEQEVTTEASFTDEIDLDDDSDQDDEDSIYRLPTMSVSRARAEILERVSRLGAIVDNHSLDSIRHPLSQSQVGSLEQMFDDALDKRLLILSLFGWDAAKGQSLLACEACHTQCALIPHVDRADSDLQGSSKEPDSFSDIEEETGFNVEEAHKWYCYWVNPEYDAESVSDHKRAGWRILFELLLSSSIVERGVLHSQQPPEVPHSQPSEQLARIRQMLRPASRTVS